MVNVFGAVRRVWRQSVILDEVIASLRPTLNEGIYAYTTVPVGADAPGIEAIASFREREGLTLVAPREQVVAAGLPVLFSSRWITLEVNSALEGVGLTAAFSTALAAVGIGCNVVAAARHDHIFVPAAQADDAMDCLLGLQARARARRGSDAVTIEEADPDDHRPLGALLVRAYAALEGFPRPHEQPAYYELLENIGQFAAKPGVKLLVARLHGNLAGGVVYFSDMSQYGAAGIAASIRDASGFRLLGVDPSARGHGIGRKLTLACIEEAKSRGHRQVVIHSTRAMSTAWRMYERLGFVQSEDLDFMQGSLAVFGFRMNLR